MAGAGVAVGGPVFGRTVTTVEREAHRRLLHWQLEDGWTSNHQAITVGSTPGNRHWRRCQPPPPPKRTLHKPKGAKGVIQKAQKAVLDALVKERGHFRRIYVLKGAFNIESVEKLSGQSFALQKEYIFNMFALPPSTDSVRYPGPRKKTDVLKKAPPQNAQLLVELFQNILYALPQPVSKSF